MTNTTTTNTHAAQKLVRDEWLTLSTHADAEIAAWSLTDEMQRYGFHYSELAAHRVDLMVGHVLTANDGTSFRVAPAVPSCWCGREATYRLPVDPCVTNPTTEMSDGMPAVLACDGHVDRDGYEALAPRGN